MELHSASSASVAKRLDKLARLYEQGPASDLTARTLDKVIEYEANLAQTQLNELRGDLAAFEAGYQMTSDVFYRAYRAGETDDRMEFIEWASLIQMANNLEARIDLLTGEEKERPSRNTCSL